MKLRLLPVALLAALAPVAAHASNALEFPDNGVAQFSRGGAWLATATDPIAAHYNPAALATMPTSFGLGMNLVFQTMCFERLGEDGQPMSYDGTQPTAPTYPRTCNLNSDKPRFVPNLAFAYRLSERLGVGLAVVPPASNGATDWPDVVPVTVTLPNGSRTELRKAAPQRYLGLKSEGTILFPTLAVGYAVTDDLRLGAGFISGITILELRSASIATQQSSSNFDVASNDSRSKINVMDLFIPGVVVGGHWSATERLDLGVWYRWIDRISAEGDLEVRAPYYEVSGTRRPACADVGGTQGCAEDTRSTDYGEDRALVEITLPMEARVGARFHVPFPAPSRLQAESFRQDDYPDRDPLRDDVFDLELDLTWANNSAADEVKVRFPANTIIVRGIEAGTVPGNADRPTGYRDSFGARLGGQWTAMRNKLGLRYGSWIESAAVEAEYLTVTGVPALRGGFGGGVVLRVGRVDVEVGYQHHWNAGLDNGGQGKLRAILGTGRADNRSYHTVNGGSIEQHANVFSLGVVARF